MLFFTMQRVKGAALHELEQQFGDWLKTKYGSLEKAQAAWQGKKHDGRTTPRRRRRRA